jgi:hypothetical protein
MLLLFIGEFYSFLQVEHLSHVYVNAPRDTGNTHAEIIINMNVTFPKLPCAIVSVDAQDVMGSHVLDVGGELHKTRLDSNMKVKTASNGMELPVENTKPEEMIGEGCNLHGHMIVKRVPGNWHISAHAHAELLGKFFPDNVMNVSHIIHSVGFGDEAAMQELQGIDASVTNPLAGAFKQSSAENPSISYEYFLTVVPTNYLKSNGLMVESYQFTANSNEVANRYRIPAVYFRYEFEGVTVLFSDKTVPFYHFVVQVCAIIGGVFTVAGLISGLLLKTTQAFKRNINKLG